MEGQTEKDKRTERFMEGGGVKDAAGAIWIARLRFVSSLLLRFNIQYMNFTVTLGSSLPRTTQSYTLKPR
jgi:hypothetical protein